jgi:hypothetical protein
MVSFWKWRQATVWFLTLGLMARMSDDRMIRHDNLLLLLKMRGWEITDLQTAIGCSYTHAYRLVHNKTTFGEKAARNYEEKLKLVRGWFDRVNTEGQYSQEAIRSAMPPESPESLATEEPRMSYPHSYGVADSVRPALTTFTANNDPVTTMLRSPVIKWEQLGKDLTLNNAKLAADVWLPVPPSASSACKWVTVEQDHPRLGIKRGHQIAVEPLAGGQPLEQGEVYLFANVAGQFLLGELRHLAGGNYEALPDSGPPLEAVRHGIRAVALHVGTWKGQ